MSRKTVRKLLLIGSVLLIVLTLSGCTSASSDPIPTDQLPDIGFWYKFIVFPVSITLDFFANLLFGQYGLSILIVTIIIRFAILPLTLKQYRSSKAMQALQPELKKLKEKYKDDSKRQQEETMKLFQANGVNPLAGCFPLLIQMPILLALYNAIILNPEIRDHTFLWLNLGEPDKIALPLIAAITTYLQQKMMQSQMPKSPMQNIMIVFPILIFVMSMSFPSALPLYWIFSNIFTLVQTYFIYGVGKNKGEKAK